MFAYTILKGFIKIKDVFKKGIRTIGNAVDYVRENTELHSLFIKC